MFLAEVGIEGFRRLKKLDLHFTPGLNVLVGPNNVGKTAVIDALRGLFSATTDEGALWIDEDDLHVSSSREVAPEIRFSFLFKGLSVHEQADFLPALVPVRDAEGRVCDYDARFYVQYALSGIEMRMRVKRWCGSLEQNPITPDMLESLRAVYLPPLRDPASGLRPSRNSQLAKLVHRMTDSAARDEIVAALVRLDAELTQHGPMADVQSSVSRRHEEMLGVVMKQALRVGLAPPDFKRIAARLSLAVDNLDVEQNGLGYNNLIYMAVVLSELSSTPETAYKALIIEEPEAHLHPQLQAILLQYLQSKDIPLEGVNAVQVFVTSHSPHFASLASLDTIACLHQTSSDTRVFSPREVEFEKTKKAKLQRYLDVTRADLFFARRIMLVEGAAELFMIGVLARRLSIDLKKLSITIINTEGLNFDAFLPLFGSDRLSIRVAMISDADPPNSYPQPSDPMILSPAAKKLSMAGKDGVQVFLAQKTFEYDLALHPPNRAAMLEALGELHPQVASQLRTEVDQVLESDKARTLFRGMFERDGGKRNVQKGAFAQALAQVVDGSDIDFVVPDYIDRALRFVTA
jgi:putative ATP-dependent endonuclease of OLD family